MNETKTKKEETAQPFLPFSNNLDFSYFLYLDFCGMMDLLFVPVMAVGRDYDNNNLWRFASSMACLWYLILYAIILLASSNPQGSHLRVIQM